MSNPYYNPLSTRGIKTKANKYTGVLSDQEFEEWKKGSHERFTRYWKESHEKFTRSWREFGSSIIEVEQTIWSEKVKPFVHEPKYPKSDEWVGHPRKERYAGFMTGNVDTPKIEDTCKSDNCQCDICLGKEQDDNHCECDENNKECDTCLTELYDNTCFGDCEKPCRRFPKLCRMHRLMND